MAEGKPASAPAALRTDIGPFERLPKWLNAIPILIQWLWLSLRHLSFTLPTAANPFITCGGLVGEGKQEYFASMGEFAASFIAPCMPLAITPDFSLAEALGEMKKRNLAFPLVAKPDIGWCGYGVQRIENAGELETYIRAYPPGQTLLLQRYIADAGEAGLFYVRSPGEPKGKLTGITLRFYPKVTGDGIKSIGELIAREPRLARLSGNPLHEVRFDPMRIPAKGEEVRLSTIGSTRVGGLYRDGSAHITPGLESVIDLIARDMKEFHIGRFDVRYESLGALREGKGFTIMEVNGVGSESVHAWDPKYSIRESYRIIFAKQRMLFALGKACRSHGHRPIGLVGLAYLYFFQQKLIRLYPLSN